MGVKVGMPIAVASSLGDLRADEAGEKILVRKVQEGVVGGAASPRLRLISVLAQMLACSAQIIEGLIEGSYAKKKVDI